MIKFKMFAGIMVLGAGIAAVPAQAVITTFASFSPIGNATNLRWVNSGSNGSSGTGGTVYSTATGTGTVPGSRDVSFSFLLPALSPLVSDVTAIFTLNGAVAAGNPVLLIGNFLLQDNVAGSFSFLSTSAITVGHTIYAAGSNLLTGTFTGTAIAGQRNGTSASFAGSTAGGDLLTYTSDFLSFMNVQDSDFSMSLSSVASPLQAIPTSGTPTRALRSFRAVGSGTFSTDPAPLVNGVPEPEMWALMLAGFGMVGLQLRRRGTMVSIAS